jgi:hypothetical protein
MQTGRITVKLDAFALGMVLLELLTGKRPSQKLKYKVEKHVPGALSTTMGPAFSAVLDKRVKKWTLPNSGSEATSSGRDGTLEMAMIALEMLNNEDDERLSVVDAVPRLEALLDTT